jgi:NAD(P)-dependent dehydrogenase (short-subunit alcohol dehydrogenase family)
MAKRPHSAIDTAPLYAGDRLTSAAYDNLPGGFSKCKFETNAKNRFTGKTIIVTGGAGNFGKCCAKRMASEGCNVAIWDLVDATPVAEEIAKEYKVKAQAFKINITNCKAVAETAAKVKEVFGKIDYLFNNAGYQGHFTQAKDYDPEDFKKVMDINCNGVFYVLQAVANIMAKDGGGAIVNTASMAAHSGPSNMIAYGTSKAACFHMTRIAAKDYAPLNIRVNSISPAFIGPGFMWTRQIELQAAAGSVYYDSDPNVVAKQMVDCTWLKRYGLIDEVIGPVTFLFSDDASYLTGQDIQITGGM